jgi:hypothetical protein
MLKRVLFTIPVVLVAYVLAYGFPVASGETPAALGQNQASTSATQQHDQPSQGNMPDMMAVHQQMMQMMAEMKAADAKLDQLVSQMNAAKGQPKISAIAEVVNELAKQQKMMHEHMGTMHDQMMSGGGMMMKKP